MAKNKKIITLAELVKIASRFKKTGKKIVTTNGCFDLLHVGHVRSFEKAKSFGDVLMVGVNADAGVRKLKGKGRPIISAKERAEMIAALECVDYVFVFSSATPLPWLKKIRPDIHVKGADRKLSEIKEWPLIKSYGGKIKLTPSTHSTTNIIKKVKAL